MYVEARRRERERERKKEKMTVEEKELKHLGFVPAAATSAIATAEPYYTNLKSNAGMLKVMKANTEIPRNMSGMQCVRARDTGKF